MNGFFRASRPHIRQSRKASFFAAVLGILSILILPFMVEAQDLKKLEPPPIPPQVDAPGTAVKPPSAPKLPIPDERVIVEALRGLIFVDRSEAVVKKAVIPKGGIDTGRLPRLQTHAFRKIAESYLGKPVSMAALNRLITEIYAYYRGLDLPFVSATLPDQDITEGVVQILIIEGALGRMRVEGAKWFSEKEYLSAIRLRQGEPIRLSILDEDIKWINRNPFRQANVFFDKGEAVGDTNLVLRTNERFPLRVYAGYNNYGNESTDRNQLLAGFNWGNAFGLGHLLTYQYTTSPDFQQLSGHSGSYTIPLKWRDTLTISGAYSNIKPNMPEPFDRNGMSGQASIRYDIDLPAIGSMRHTVGIMPEYKVTDNNLLFSNILITENRTDIMQLSAVYSGEIADAWGASRLGLKLTGSPGDLSGRNKTEYFEISRAYAKANYIYGTLDLGRTQPLPLDFSMLLSGHLQLANGNLLGSEQLGLGGVNSVRGFKEGIVYGDWGYLLRAELYAPAILIHQILPFSLPSMPLKLLGFYDYGTVGSVDRLPNEPRENTLQSAGLGLRFAVDRYVSLQFDYGWCLSTYPGVDYSSRAHFSVIVSY